MKKFILSLFLFFLMTVNCFAACETSIDGHEICDFSVTDWYGVFPAPALSNVGTARVYFDFSSGKLKCSEDGGAYTNCVGSGGGSGTVTSVSVATANGFSGTVANATTTPAITIIAGAITPTSVNGVTISGSLTPTLAVTGTTAVSGTNTGDQSLTSAGGWTDGGTNVFLTTTTDLVGVGTTTPTATLLVQNVGAGDSFRVNDDLLDSTPFIISPNGNVGIGTTNPTSLLEVSSTAAQDLFRVNDNGAADATPFIVDLNGNVGIGTSLPVAKFNILDGGTTASSLFDIYMDDENPWAFRILNKTYSTNLNNAVNLLQYNTGVAAFQNRGQMAFILGTGKVGVGNTVTAPRFKIDIYASSAAAIIDSAVIRLQDTGGDTNSRDWVIANGWTDYGHLDFSAGTGSGVEPAAIGIKMTIDNTGKTGIGDTLPDATLEVVKISSTPVFMLSSSASADGDYMIVNSSGNVGIGTLSPMNTLQVKGTMQIDNTGNAGGSVQSAANQACNTTCVSACMLGFDTGTLGISLAHIVGCADATADECFCMGPS